MKNTEPTGTSVDQRSPKKADDGTKQNAPATVYGDRNAHVVVNDLTGEVVHISNKKDSDWTPDSRIEWFE